MKTKGRVGFWRRLAAFWIDAFVIYSLAKVVIVLLSLMAFRISFEAIFVITGAFYAVVMLSKYRQTTGKMLLKTGVASINDEPLHFRDILLRELFGKWGTTVLLPVLLGMILEKSWLPTVSGLEIMVPVVLANFIYYLFAKRAWYEALAGMTVKRVEGPQTVKTGFLILIAAALLGIGTTTAEFLVKGRIPCRMAAFQNSASTKPYVRFLEKQNTAPVDYVMGLFEKYDVVVLCERAHPEMTQWDFIFDVVRDPRFIEKVGHVFTEYGQTGIQGDLDKFMMTDSLNDREVKANVLHLMRNLGVWPAWTNNNFNLYLARLYRLNQTLSPENRIQHHFTDGAVDWSAIRTVSDYKKYQKNIVWNRDSIMAGTVITGMKSIAETLGKPAKCLVIMNYRHGMDLTDRLPDVKRVNTFEFMKDSFGNRAANVLINTRFLISVPLAGGVWDAAFEQTGNRPVGFDFRGSPFGNSGFDLFPFNNLLKPGNTPSSNGSLRYRDVFTGFVFTHPVKDQYLQSNIPGYFDGFETEYIRRMACLDPGYKPAAEEEMKDLRNRDADGIRRHLEFTIETIVELCFYGFAAIGLLIGLGVFPFRKFL
ncbi:MAG: RDD family protein [Bacteroidota bacterium]